MPAPSLVPAGPRRAFRAVAGAVLAAVSLTVAGCASSEAPTNSSTTATELTSTAPTSTTPSTVPSSGDASTTLPSAQAPGAVVQLSGVVEDGVEAGCVVLLDASGGVLANLIGWDAAAHPMGSQVEVTGSFAMDVMTTCQQGRPFEVTEVSAQ